MGLSALSQRLVVEDVKRGVLKPMKVTRSPLRRQIRVVQLKDAFVLKAVQQFLQCVSRSQRGKGARLGDG